MAIKTFTTGEVLTASDTNTYLANSGLQYIAGATFSNVGSFDVTGITSTWTHYTLTITVKRATANGALTGVIYSGATARNTSYYGGQRYVDYLGATGNYALRNIGANFGVVDYGTDESFVSMWFAGIGNNTFRTTIQTFDALNTLTGVGGYSNYNATSSFDMIRFTGSTNISGIWNLTGVRKA